MTLTSTESKQLVGRYLQAISGQRKTPDLVARFVSDPSLAAHIGEVEAAFPGYELIADDVLGERDLVAVRGVFRGVHRGTFAGVRETGRSVSAPFMIIYRIDGGRIAEHWMQFDGAALMHQLEAPAAPTGGNHASAVARS